MRKNGTQVDDKWTEPNCERCQQLLLQIHSEFHRNNPPLSPKALALFRAKTHPTVGRLLRREQDAV